MKPTEVFNYTDFQLTEDHRAVAFHYSVTHDGETIHLSERLRFPQPIPATDEAVQTMRGLHLALGMSYYKLFVSPRIEHPYAMNEKEASFWNLVWRQGLGEFLYVNDLPVDRLAQFSPQEGAQPKGEARTQWSDTALLGIGGGKDSIVAGELLTSTGVPYDGFVMATGTQLGQTQEVAELLGVKLHAVERNIDPSLIELNKRADAYNGHVPISLIYALVGMLAASSLGYKYVVVANESSASIPRIQTNELSVNHQWSKSLEFEKAFQDFIRSNISDTLTYFSAVRPLNSVAIAKLFCQHPLYLETFTSDNSVFKLDPSKRPDQRWSLKSPKSLSSFILLAPWLNPEQLISAFGRNFLDEPVLEPLFEELVGLRGEQPLDCVGTVEELRASLKAALDSGKFASSYLGKKASAEGICADGTTPLETFLKLSDDDALPAALRANLRNKMTELLT